MEAAGKTVVEEVLRRDTECRRVGRDFPLYTLSDLRQQSWDFTLPTLTKGRNYTDVRQELSISISGFIAQFYRRYPILKGITFKNILVAGGSVSTIVSGASTSETPDVDIFVYGLSPEEASTRSALIIEEIQANIRKLMVLKNPKTGEPVHRHHEFSAFLMKNDDTCTLQIGSTKIQIIFRLYNHASEVLHGFDLGSSAIGFDGTEVYLTGLGKFAFEYGCNIIDTTRRSTSYEKRLVKYFDRDFSIIMPNLDVSKLRTSNNRYQIDEICEIPRFVFAYSSVRNNNITVTRTLMVKGDAYDYAPGEIREETMVKFNITQLLTRGDEANLYVRTRQLTPKVFTLECYLTDDLIELFYRDVQASLMPSAFKPGLAEKFLTVIPFADLVKKLLIERVDKHVFVPKLIDLQVQETKAALRRYKARHVPGIKWRTENPGGQAGLLTSSINPIMAVPEDWYGEYFTSTVEVDESIIKLHAAELEKRRQGRQNWVVEVESSVFAVEPMPALAHAKPASRTDSEHASSGEEEDESGDE